MNLIKLLSFKFTYLSVNYRFNYGSGNSAKDSSGSCNSGKLDNYFLLKFGIGISFYLGLRVSDFFLELGLRIGDIG